MKTILTIILAIFFASSAGAESLTAREWQQNADQLRLQLEQNAAAVIAGEARPIKCVTPMFLGLFHTRPEEVFLKPAYTDREDTLSFSYGTSHFKIHYTSTGRHAVYQYDQQDSLPGVPDYIFEAGKIVEEVYDRYLDSLGYDPPLSDGYYNGGGDGRMDIYIIDLGAYGATVVDSLPTPVTATAYIFLENDYLGFPGYENNRLNALRVGVAHEYFHAIQFAYDVAEVELTSIPGDINASWIEMSATFMEEEHYDAINDYLGYLSFFYDFPHWSLKFGTYQGGLYLNRNFHMYGAVVWPLFLKEKYDADMVRNIWDSCRAVPGPNWLAATEDVLALRSGGSRTMADLFGEFTLWNLFTRNWARAGQFFEEAATFERVYIAAQIDNYPTVVEVHDTLLPDNLGANYILLNNTASIPSGLMVTFEANQSYSWRLQVIGLPANVAVDPIIIDTAVYTEDSIHIAIPNAAAYNRIALIPAVVDGNDSTVNYALIINALGQGVIQPNGGEQLYAGNTFNITWYYGDSVTTVDIDFSIDSGQTWLNIIQVPNTQQIYAWLIPEMASTSCLVRVADADNPTVFDISDDVFTIAIAREDQVFEPFPNPAWVPSHDSATVKVLISPRSGQTRVALTILNLAGEKVRDNLPVKWGTGVVSIGWDFTNNDGEIVAAGLYLAVIELGDETVIKKIMVMR